MVQLDIFQDETTKKYLDTFESCMINISEGASEKVNGGFMVEYVQRKNR